MSIHLNTNIITAINAIDAGELDPVVDVNREVIYWLDTSKKALANLMYTEFNKLTGVGIRSFSVRYATYHRVVEVIFGGAMIRNELPLLLDMFPKYTPTPKPDPTIIPSCY